MKKVLFICKYNFVRSREGARFFSKLVEEKGKKMKIDSCGLSIFAWLFGKRLRKQDLKGVDLIFVMEHWMEKEIKLYGYKGKIVDLNIKNNYWVVPFFGKESVSKLREVYQNKKLERYL